jgi:hypothetical protein
MRRNDQQSTTHQVSQKAEHPERRAPMSDRRNASDRRSNEERRYDNRLAPVKQPKSMKAWIRSLTNSRLGVDRRKKADRRSIEDRRQQRLESLLTKEELADLLGD